MCSLLLLFCRWRERASARDKDLSQSLSGKVTEPALKPRAAHACQSLMGKAKNLLPLFLPKYPSTYVVNTMQRWANSPVTSKSCLLNFQLLASCVWFLNLSNSLTIILLWFFKALFNLFLASWVVGIVFILFASQKKCGLLVSNSWHSVYSLSCVWLFAIPWTTAHQASLSINSRSLLKPMSIELVIPSIQFISVHFSCSVMSDSLWPHEPQHTRPPCPSPTPGVHSNSCPLSRWCHPAISSSVIPFSSCP